MADVKEQDSTKVLTGLVRFSYPHVWEPDAMDGGEKKYSVNILIKKTDKAMIATINAAIDAAKKIGKTSKWQNKIPANLKTPLRDGDIDRPEDENYAGHYFINCSSKSKPGIVDKNRQEIVDQEDFYSGCYGRVTINFYPYDAKGNKGVGAGLNNIQKLKDGEPLGGTRRSPEDDFAEDFDLPEEEDDDDLI